MLHICTFVYTGIYISITNQGSMWQRSYGNWIYNYLCNQCLSPLTLWERIQLKWNVIDTILCDNVCQWLEAGRWLSLVLWPILIYIVQPCNFYQMGLNKHGLFIFVSFKAVKWEIIYMCVKGVSIFPPFPWFFYWILKLIRQCSLCSINTGYRNFVKSGKVKFFLIFIIFYVLLTSKVLWY